MSMEQLIFEIFTTFAEEAMDRGYEIKLSFEDSDNDNSAFLSKSSQKSKSLAMNMWIPTQSEDYENGYEDGYDDGCMDLMDDGSETD